MARPLVSVVIPTYNRAKFLHAAVASITAQTFNDYEIIIADDGSADNTSEVVKTLPVPVRYIPYPHGGKSAVLNSALKDSQGEWFAVLDSDDLWLPRKLERQFEVLKQYPQSKFCFTDVILKDKPDATESAFMQSGKQFKELLCHIPNTVAYVLTTPHDIFVQASAIKRDLLVALGGFNEKLIAEDTDIIFRASIETTFTVVNEPLVIVDRMPVSRDGSIMSQIKGSREVDLKYRQAMYEGWLALGSKLSAPVEQQIRGRLAKVHDAWANWHLESGQVAEAAADFKRGLQVQHSLPRALKSFGMNLWPGGTAAILNRRGSVKRLVKG